MPNKINYPRIHEAFQITDTLMNDGDVWTRLCAIGYPKCKGDVFVFDGEQIQCQKCGEKETPDPNEITEWTYKYLTGECHG